MFEISLLKKMVGNGPSGHHVSIQKFKFAVPAHKQI